MDTNANDAPSKYSEIFKRSDSESWLDAVEEENKALLANKVFIQVNSLPEGKNLVKAKYIFKRKSDGRYKARLVAKGYSQVFGVDFKEVYAPVVSKNSLRMLLALAAEERWNIHQLDVKTAFLHGDLEEDIYMEAPEGMPFQKGSILRLNKSLYGLKQAPRQWNIKLDKFIASCGFTRCRVDSSVYIKGSGNNATIIAVYVDDMLIFGHDNKFICDFKSKLNDQFKIDDLGEVRNILGMEVNINRSDNTISLSQRAYINKLIDKFRMKDAKSRPKCVPLYKTDYNTVMDIHSKQAQPTSMPYKSALGGLLYTNVCCRPDISFPISVLTSHNQNPKQVHWNSLMNVIRYLKQTNHFEIKYGDRQENQLRHGIYIYADADYARDPVKYRSRSGFVIYMNGGPISWHSDLQERVAGSTSEAELYAMYADV